MPPGSQGVTEPAATALADFGGSRSARGPPRPASRRTRTSRSARKSVSASRPWSSRYQRRASRRGAIASASRDAMRSASRERWPRSYSKKPVRRVEEVPGLEQAEHHREQREARMGRRCAREMKPNTSISHSTVEPKSASTCTQSCWARVGGALAGTAREGEPAGPVEAPDALTRAIPPGRAERGPPLARAPGRRHTPSHASSSAPRCAGVRAAARASSGSSRCARSR